MTFRHPVFRLVVTLVSILLAVGLSRSTWVLWGKRDIVREREEVLGKLKADNEVLRSRLAEAESTAFVERVAREQLGLVREGEKVVILPTSRIRYPNDQVKHEAEEVLPNWKKWWKLFF